MGKILKFLLSCTQFGFVKGESILKVLQKIKESVKQEYTKDDLQYILDQSEFRNLVRTTSTSFAETLKILSKSLKTLVQGVQNYMVLRGFQRR